MVPAQQDIWLWEDFSQGIYLTHILVHHEAPRRNNMGYQKSENTHTHTAFQKFGISKILNIFKRSLLCSPRPQLFN